MRKRLAVALVVALSGCTVVGPGQTAGQSLSATFETGRCEVGAAPGPALEGRGEYPIDLSDDSATAIERFVRSFERAYAYNEFDGRRYEEFSVSLSGTVVEAGGGAATVRVRRVDVVGRRGDTVAEYPHSVTYRLMTTGMTRNDSRPGQPPPPSEYNYVVECG